MIIKRRRHACGGVICVLIYYYFSNASLLVENLSVGSLLRKLATQLNSTQLNSTHFIFIIIIIINTSCLYWCCLWIRLLVLS
jgi:hypothetical protein